MFSVRPTVNDFTPKIVDDNLASTYTVQSFASATFDDALTTLRYLVGWVTMFLKKFRQVHDRHVLGTSIVHELSPEKFVRNFCDVDSRRPKIAVRKVDGWKGQGTFVCPPLLPVERSTVRIPIVRTIHKPRHQDFLWWASKGVTRCRDVDALLQCFCSVHVEIILECIFITLPLQYRRMVTKSDRDFPFLPFFLTLPPSTRG